MPYTAEHKRRTRQRILREASHAFREHGLDGVSIPAVMNQAGLTHGGFYAHFASKDALIASSFAEGFGESAERLLDQGADKSPHEALAAIIRAYLSRAHRDAPASGCVAPALSAEVARASGEVRAGYTTALRAYAQRLAALLPPSATADADDAARRETDALTLLAGMAGALQLARAVDDPTLSDAILLRARTLYIGMYATPDPTTESAAEADTVNTAHDQGDAE
jgi:TetR/AcrR family transcriptional repressor of nem operon